jgi:hypothetical protein
MMLGVSAGLTALLGAAPLDLQPVATPRLHSDTSAPGMHDALCRAASALVNVTSGALTAAVTATEGASTLSDPADAVAEAPGLEVRGLCGDLNLDAAVDESDYDIFLAAFGHCAGQAGFDALADLDADTCITLVDYQAWLVCYNAANGVAPAAAPAALECSAVTPAQTAPSPD